MEILTSTELITTIVGIVLGYSLGLLQTYQSNKKEYNDRVDYILYRIGQSFWFEGEEYAKEWSGIQEYCKVYLGIPESVFITYAYDPADYSVEDLKNYISSLKK